MKRITACIAAGLLLAPPAWATCSVNVPRLSIDRIFIFEVYDADGNTPKTDLTSEASGLIVKFSNNAGDEFVYDNSPTSETVPVTAPCTGAHGNTEAQVRLSHCGEGTMEMQVPDAWFADATASQGSFKLYAPNMFAVDCMITLDPMTSADITLAVNASDNAKQTNLVAVAADVDTALTAIGNNGTAVADLRTDLDDGSLDVALEDGSIVAATFGADAITDAVLAPSVGTELGTAVVTGTAIAEPTTPFTWPASIGEIQGWQGVLSRNKILQTDTTQTLRNDADSANLGTSTQSDDGTTYTRGEWVP